jgi:holo-[acyl-carrier protein] synthase
MTQAIGIDIVDLDRFERTCERWGERFWSKILTTGEIAVCHTKSSAVSSMAVRFAAKEAFIKCLSEDEYRFFRWHRIEVLSAPTGKPYIRLNGPLADSFAQRSILLSLSHSGHTAAAVVMIE